MLTCNSASFLLVLIEAFDYSLFLKRAGFVSSSRCLLDLWTCEVLDLHSPNMRLHIGSRRVGIEQLRSNIEF